MHRSRFQIVLATLILLLGSALCFSQNPYNAKLELLEQSWTAAGTPERAARLARIYELREYVDDPAAVTHWMSQVSRDTAQSKLLRDEALHYLGLMQAHEGRLDEAERTKRELGSENTFASEDVDALKALAPEVMSAKVRQAEYYVERRQLEKARDLLREAVAASPADFVARERLAELYARAGLKSVALAEYRKLEAEFPAPLWLRRELAERYEEIGMLDKALALAQSALAQNVDGRRERDVLRRIYERRGEAEKLRALYVEMARLDPSDTQPLLHLAQLDAAAGHFAAAEANMRAALAIAPNDGALHEQLGNVLAEAGKDEEARGELATALRLKPNSEELRLRVSLEKSSPKPNPGLDGAPTVVSGTQESQYLVDAAEVAAEAQRNPPRDEANAVELAEVRVERVYENGLSATRMQQVFYIGSEQGAREYASHAVQYAAATQELQVLAARAYKPDGRVVEAEDAGENGVADGGAAMYYDARSRTLRFPGLEKGDVIELDYRLKPESNVNPYGDYFGELVAFRSSLPERLQRYVLITPAARTFNVMEERMPSAAQVRVEKDERVYQWEARDLAPLPNEPRGPALTETAPYVHVSSFATWQELGHWYAQLIAPQFALDAALRQTLQQIVAGKKTDLEKISAIHQFVLRNTHYVALEFGIYGYKPYPVSQVYARRFGDCKDKASLMIALLRAAGIDADIALVRTRRLGEIGKQATSISIFNHAIVYVPKYKLWLDGTAEYAGSRELPLDDQGAMALTVAQDGAAELRRIPVTLPMENYTHRSVQAQIEPDGKIQFTGSAYTRGEDAPGLRRDFEIAERQRDSFRNRLAEVLPSVRLDAVQVSGANNVEDDVTVKYRGEIDAFAGRGTLTLSPSWMPRAYVQKLAPLASRTQDLLLPAPWTTEEELHFILPAGARLEAVPQDKTLDTPFGSAVLHYQRVGNELVVTTSVQFRKLRITPAEYVGFREFCAQVEAAFRAEIKVGLKG